MNNTKVTKPNYHRILRMKLKQSENGVIAYIAKPRKLKTPSVSNIVSD